MKDQDLRRWVLEHGGPAVRYRTVTELLSEPPEGVGRLEPELLASPIVQTWLDRLDPPLSPALQRLPARAAAFAPMKHIHGAHDTAFENVMGKLIQYGCRAGMPALDEKTKPWRQALEGAGDDRGRMVEGEFLVNIVAAFVWMAGYREGAVLEHISKRLERIAGFVKEGRYDIYIDQDTYPGFPASYRKHKLIDPEVHAGLPQIADVLAFAQGQEQLDRDAVDAVVKYVLNERYQRLPHGYGVVYMGERKFYTMGWDVRVPGYFGMDDMSARDFVQRVVMMAHFPRARKHRWLRESVAYLEQFRTDAGTYVFPAALLRETSPAYWVAGGRMALEEARRTKRVHEVESTFWMPKIRKAAGLTS